MYSLCFIFEETDIRRDIWICLQGAIFGELTLGGLTAYCFTRSKYS